MGTPPRRPTRPRFGRICGGSAGGGPVWAKTSACIPRPCKAEPDARSSSPQRPPAARPGASSSTEPRGPTELTSSKSLDKSFRRLTSKRHQMRRKGLTSSSTTITAQRASGQERQHCTDAATSTAHGASRDAWNNSGGTHVSPKGRLGTHCQSRCILAHVSEASWLRCAQCERSKASVSFRHFWWHNAEVVVSHLVDSGPIWSTPI